MAERNLAILAAREAELRFTQMTRDTVGFLCGLDEFNYQVCRTDDGRQVLLTRELVHSVEPTGVSLREVKPEQHRETIRRNIAMFVKVCAKNIESKKEGDDG